MAKPNILVVDSDEGFGMMLKEGLENSGHYFSVCVHTGSDAIQAIVENSYELAIIDMALTDMSPAALIQAMRKAKDGMRVMIIPLIGQSVPQSIEALSINGVLTKPFFVGDLPDLIDEAIGRKRESRPVAPVRPEKSDSPKDEVVEPSARENEIDEVVPEATPELPPPLAVASVSSDTLRYLRANETEILRLLGDLNREVRAEAILLIAGLELIAHAGMLGRDQCQQLTMLVAQSAQAAAQAAGFLGEPAGHFGQSLHEGEAYRLYSLSLGEGIFLSLALSSNVPLGMIRHQCRQIADQLSKFII